MSEKTPYIGFGNDTLEKLPKVSEGDLIKCPECGEKHPLVCSSSDGKKHLMMFYVCNGDTYLGAVSGRLIVGVKVDCSGEI